MSASAHVAIIGAGPSGLFTAQALLRAVPGVAIDIIDRLPVPYGLIRYGVAPDHQGTKAITRQFDRMFERDGVQFHGGVEIGRHVALPELSELYDAVVIATGLPADRRLDIPGEDLPGIIRAGRLTRWINSHPDEAAAAPALGAHVVIIGNGNVALDAARLLAKTEAELQGSDFDPARAEAIAACGIRTIDIVGRSGAEKCRFDPAMIKEIAQLSAARIEVTNAAAGAVSPDAAARLSALQAVNGAGPADAPCHIRFRFGHVPVAVLGRHRVEAVRFATHAGETLDLPATSVITAIGFAADDRAPMSRDTLLAGRENLPYALGGNVFAAGWFRSGPTGAIPDARRDAKGAADAVAATLRSGAQRPGRRGLAALLSRRNLQPLSYADWQRIRAAEEAAAPPGRLRLKFTTVDDMINLTTLAA